MRPRHLTSAKSEGSTRPPSCRPCREMGYEMAFLRPDWMPFGTRMSVNLRDTRTKLNPSRALCGVPPQSWVTLLSLGPQNVTFFEIESLWV